MTALILCLTMSASLHMCVLDEHVEMLMKGYLEYKRPRNSNPSINRWGYMKTNSCTAKKKNNQNGDRKQTAPGMGEKPLLVVLQTKG